MVKLAAMNNTPLTVRAGDNQYTWLDQWAKIPDTPSGRNNGKTHDVAVLENGHVIVFHQAVPGVLFYDPNGKLIDAWGDRFAGAHGLSVARHDSAEHLWLVDQFSCEVCRVDLKGKLQQRLDPPPADDRPEGKYNPTTAIQNPSNGDIWVADGYGGSAVYRYDADGRYLAKLTGEETNESKQSPGRFACPHGIGFGPDGLLYIPQRATNRISVYDDQGRYVKQKENVTQAPCSIDFHNGQAVIAELFASLKILDDQLNIVATIGQDDRIVNDKTRPAGWPNLAKTNHLKPGLFNSPHGARYAPNGDIYVVEWIVGGRITKLQKQ